MTVKEYLRQAYHLDQRISAVMEETQNLRAMAGNVSAVRYDTDHVQTSPSADASFVRALEKLWDLEEKAAEELNLLSDLKRQVREVIESAPNTDERLVLQYRYIHNLTWEQIGTKLHADRTTVYRWHGNALNHVKLPEEPIVI